MWSQINNKFFWFTQPSSFLSPIDKQIGYFFLALFILAIICRVMVRFSKNEVNKRVFRKFWHMLLPISLIGLLWYGLRYENTPILAIRAWVGIDMIAGLIWLLFILKFIIFDYRPLKREYSNEQLRNKYLPKSR